VLIQGLLLHWSVVTTALVCLFFFLMLCNLSNIRRASDWVCDVRDTIPEFWRGGFGVLNVIRENQWLISP
jgi:hypothetical protein